MKDIFDGPFPEPSALTGFSQNRLVRDSENRDGDTLHKALADPAARFHLFFGAKALVREDDRPTATFTVDEARQFRHSTKPPPSCLARTKPVPA